jgi:nicotinamidase-related amidase
MSATMPGPDIQTSALIVVDMQNDFVHPDGHFGYVAREFPERNIDIAFLTSSIGPVKRLVDAFRRAERPVIFLAHVLKSDYSDAQFPYWRGTKPSGNRTFIVEDTWGARIVDELTPLEHEHVVVKKGYGGFSNTPLDTILRNKGVTTCVVAGVTTGVCVSTTVRGGVEHNYRMILVPDAVAEGRRELSDAEITILGRAFADLKTVDELVALLAA